MHGGCDNMGRCFPGQLDDIFTEIGFNGFDTSGGKGVVEPDFFGEHGFSLDRLGHIMFSGDVKAVVHCSLGIQGKMNMSPAFANVLGQCIQYDIEIFDGLHADIMRLQTQVQSFREIPITLGRSFSESFLKIDQGFVKHRVGDGGAGMLDISGLFHVIIPND